jgi:hypothetical protein
VIINRCAAGAMARFAAILTLIIASGCATTTKAHPSPRAQAVTKCLAVADAGIVAPACAALAADVAALRSLATKPE